MGQPQYTDLQLVVHPQINLTMNGRGSLVLIWVRTCRTLLGDKGTPLSREKGVRTDEHGPKKRKVRMARIQTNVYAYGLNCIHVQTELKCGLN